MLTDELVERFRAVDTTAMCDADKALRVLDSAIRLRSAQPRILGPAFTVRCRGDFLGVLRAVESAAPGDVIVVDGGGSELALAGELFARGALVRGLAGIIVDGGYRDMAYVSRCDLPVYSRHVTPMAGTIAKPGTLQTPVTCGGVCVNPGDIVFADEEGIVVVDPDRVSALLDGATAVKDAEAGLLAKLAAGRTLSDGLNLDEHVAAVLRGEPSTLKFLA